MRLYRFLYRRRAMFLYAVMLLAAALVQFLSGGTVLSSFPLAVIPVCVACKNGVAAGAFCGCAAGWLWDIYADRPFGWYGLFLLLLCGMTGAFFEKKTYRKGAVFLAAFVILWLLCAEEWLYRFIESNNTMLPLPFLFTAGRSLFWVWVMKCGD